MVGAPASLAAKFGHIENKKRQRSPEAIERRKHQRIMHKKISRRKYKLYRQQISHLPKDEIKSKLKEFRKTRKSGAFVFQPAKKDLKTQKFLPYSNLHNNFATLNVRTLQNSWRLYELVAYCHHRNISVLAIQEHKLRLPSSKSETTTTTIHKKELGNGWTFYFLQAETNSVNAPIGGIGFILSPLANKSLDSITGISPRILKCQFNTSSSQKCSTYSVYSPTSVSNAQDIESFYHNLSESIINIPTQHFLVILGDFNAQLIKSQSIKYTFEKEDDPLNRNSEYLNDFLDNFSFIPHQFKI
jgi:hypothetical protein